MNKIIDITIWNFKMAATKIHMLFISSFIMAVINKLPRAYPDASILLHIFNINLTTILRNILLEPSVRGLFFSLCDSNKKMYKSNWTAMFYSKMANAELPKFPFKYRVYSN